MFTCKVYLLHTVSVFPKNKTGSAVFTPVHSQVHFLNPVSTASQSTHSYWMSIEQKLPRAGGSSHISEGTRFSTMVNAFKYFLFWKDKTVQSRKVSIYSGDKATASLNSRWALYHSHLKKDGMNKKLCSFTWWGKQRLRHFTVDQFESWSSHYKERAKGNIKLPDSLLIPSKVRDSGE